MLWKEFITSYGLEIIATLLSAAVTALGAWIGRIYKNKVNDETKRKIVKTCCKAVEQLYKDLSGAEKYNKAVESIVEMLTEKGIKITDIEIKMLIEEVCADFTKAVNDTIKGTPTVETTYNYRFNVQDENEPVVGDMLGTAKAGEVVNALTGWLVNMGIPDPIVQGVTIAGVEGRWVDNDGAWAFQFIMPANDVTAYIVF